MRTPGTEIVWMLNSDLLWKMLNEGWFYSRLNPTDFEKEYTSDSKILIIIYI